MSAAETLAIDPEDLVGRVFGAWTVLQRSEQAFSSKRGRIWDCRCRCGRTAPVIGWDLRRGHSTQCNTCAQAGRARCKEAHAKLPSHIKLTAGELLLARMLAREGLHAIGIIAIFAHRQVEALAKQAEDRKTPAARARHKEHKQASRARAKARKVAGAA